MNEDVHPYSTFALFHKFCVKFEEAKLIEISSIVEQLHLNRLAMLAHYNQIISELEAKLAKYEGTQIEGED